jgi:alkylation response protein AidB-like acyl-CoA dehydrogenase
MDFELTSELTRLREDARSFAAREIVPSVVARDQHRCWDEALFKKLAENGILGALIPRELGGLGLSALEACLVLEGLGTGSEDAGLALAVGAQGLLGMVPVWKLGTHAQKQKYLRPMASGEWLGGVSLLELEGGAAPLNLSTRAVKQGHRWKIHGAKTHVVNAPFAHHFLVTAVTRSGAVPAHVSAFLVDRDAPGLRVSEPTELSGMRTCTFADLTFEDCEVPEGALLGTEGGAFSELLPLWLALDRSCLLAPWLGMIRSITERTARAVREQALFDRPLARFQSIRAMLADMKTSCELSGDLLYRAAWQLDHLGRPPRQDAAVAKLVVSKAAQKVSRDAVQIHGLSGLASDPHVDRAYRDSMFLTIVGGTSEVLRSVIAGSMLDLG